MSLPDLALPRRSCPLPWDKRASRRNSKNVKESPRSLQNSSSGGLNVNTAVLLNLKNDQRLSILLNEDAKCHNVDLNKVIPEERFSDSIEGRWMLRFKDTEKERDYRGWLTAVNRPLRGILAVAVGFLTLALLVYHLMAMSEEDASGSYVPRVICSALAVIVSVSCSLIQPKGLEHVVFALGFSTTGILISLSASIPVGKKISILLLEPVLAFVALITAHSGITIYPALFMASVSTSASYIILISIRFATGRTYWNIWEFLSGVLSLLIVAVLANVFGYEIDVWFRTQFFERRIHFKNRSFKYEEMKNLRLEKRALMENAYSSMLKRLDLCGCKDPNSRSFESAAEKMLGSLKELCHMNLGSYGNKIAKEIHRVARKSGGELYTPFPEQIEGALRNAKDSHYAISAVFGPSKRARNNASLLLDGRLHRLRVPTSTFENISAAMLCEENKALQQLYERIDDFSFNIFDAAKCSMNLPITFILMSLLGKLRLISKFSIDLTKLRNLCDKLEKGYKTANPYHNAIHGADVCRTTYYFIRKGGVLTVMSDLETLACIVASAVHDLGHPGLTNDFLIRDGSPLAIEYNDVSVLENFHVASFYRILKTPECDILENLSPAEEKIFRKTVIEMVLATDLSKHKENLDKFKLRSARIRSMLWNSEESSEDVKISRGLTSSSPEFNDRPSPPQTQAETKQKAEDRMVMLKMVIKCADLGHAIKPLDQHVSGVEWSKRVREEFFLEGDMAKEKGFAVKPLFNRLTNKNIGKSQAGFIKFLVLPLLTELALALRLQEPILEQLEVNLKHWETQNQLFIGKNKPPEKSEQGKTEIVVTSDPGSRTAEKIPETLVPSLPGSQVTRRSESPYRHRNLQFRPRGSTSASPSLGSPVSAEFEGSCLEAKALPSTWTSQSATGSDAEVDTNQRIPRHSV